jgi:sugar/nucleoside kinase (ribokinase family)
MPTTTSSSRSGILAAGNWIVDAVKLIDAWPQQDTLANIHATTRGTGGSPFNVLIDLALLGADFPLEAAGLVGADADGEWIMAQCRARGIDTRALRRTDAAPTSFTDVMTVRSTGRRTFFHARGANAVLGPEHFDFAGTQARLFHLGYLLLLDRLDAPDPDYGTVAARVLAQARAAGLKTSIDCVSEDSDRFARIVLPALPHVDLCIMNEFEAGRVTGRRIRTGDPHSGAPGTAMLDRAELRAAMEQLLAAGVGERVIIHYPEGGCALGRDGAWHEHGSVQLPGGFIKGAAGAGDAFTAGVLHGWHEGWPVEEWLRLGVCAAAANLSDETCTGGVRPRAECLALGEKYGYRS